MGDYILYKNLEGKYLTLQDCLDENKEKHENTIFYVTDEKEQSQYINMFKEQGIDAVIMKHNIDSPFIYPLEMKNEKIKFQSIDADLTEDLVEESDEEALNETPDDLSVTSRTALCTPKPASAGTQR